jgi:DNA-binding NarL/FixJ family response regulator
MSAPSHKIRVAILDDHQSIIDGYRYRLERELDIEVVATANYGEEIEPLLTKHETDVLLLDINVPVAPDNPNPYPVLYVIPRILQSHPNLNILIISMYCERALIKASLEAGVAGYILKDDRETIMDLPGIIRSVARGGIYFSQRTYQQLRKRPVAEPHLTPRQIELLSLCAAYPDETTAGLARRLGVANSTIRNLLSDAYLQLNVHSKAAAIIRAREMGLITPPTPPLDGETSMK